MPKGMKRRKKKKKQVVLTPAEKFEHMQNLMQGVRCILRKRDLYDTYMYLSEEFAALAKTSEEEAFEGQEDCANLSEECRSKAEEIKKELPEQEIEVSRTVTKTVKEKDDEEKNKIGKDKWIVGTLIVLAILAAISYKAAPTRYVIAGIESSMGIHKYAMESYAKLKKYKDSDIKEAEEMLAYAKDLEEKDDLVGACRLYGKLADREDRDAESEECRLELELIDRAKAGDIIKYGNSEWVVVDKRESQALLTNLALLHDTKASKKAAKNIGGASWNLELFAGDQEETVWASSPLREYLNTDFIGEQFTTPELERISETELENKPNPDYGTDGGENTVDRVFIMSAEEIQPYLGMLNKLDKAKNLRLRTPGMNQLSTAFISDKIEVVYFGFPVAQKGLYNRPTMWVSFQ